MPSGGAVSAGSLVSGYADFYLADYSLTHSDQEIQEINNKNRGISEQGTTTNEDLGRYF
jgi:hypothetical protein